MCKPDSETVYWAKNNGIEGQFSIMDTLIDGRAEIVLRQNYECCQRSSPEITSFMSRGRSNGQRACIRSRHRRRDGTDRPMILTSLDNEDTSSREMTVRSVAERILQVETRARPGSFSTARFVTSEELLRARIRAALVAHHDRRCLIWRRCSRCSETTRAGSPLSLERRQPDRT